MLQNNLFTSLSSAIESTPRKSFEIYIKKKHKKKGFQYYTIMGYHFSKDGPAYILIFE